MNEAPPFEDALRHALAGVDGDDIRIFYAYLDELKAHARKHLSGKARTMPGSSAVANSALLSLFCDLALQQVPLSDVDEHGYPMLWPLLLKYVERHCDKWKAYYRAKKRKGLEADLALEPADQRASATAEFEVADICAALLARLSPEEQTVLQARLEGKTLEEIAVRIGRAEATVSNRLKRIRAVFEEL